MYYKIIASEVYVSQSLVASHYYILIKNMTMIDSNSSVMMMMMKMMMVVVVVVVVVMIIIPTQPYISSFIIFFTEGRGRSVVSKILFKFI